MIQPTCDGCRWHAPSSVYRDAGACFRRKTFVSSGPHRPPACGFSIEFETGHPDLYEGRADGDNCGQERRHYEVKK